MKRSRKQPEKLTILSGFCGIIKHRTE